MNISVDSLFYENVFLLMQVIPPSTVLETCFCKGMFDKPNKKGFLYVSHYLLTIYDAKRFEKVIHWPLFSKQDESLYCTEVTNFLKVISAENSDIQLFCINAMHIHKAGGIRFLIIMWKLSQIALRAYIERKCKKKLLRKPSLHLPKDIIEEYFHNINNNRHSACVELHNEHTQINAWVSEILQNELQRSSAINSFITETEQNLQKLISVAPVASHIRQRLSHINDEKVVEMWKASILHQLRYIAEMESIFMEIKYYSSTLCSIMFNLQQNVNTLNGEELITVNYQNASGYRLHINGLLILQTFFILLNNEFNKIWKYMNILAQQDILKCYTQVHKTVESTKQIKSAYQQLITQMSNMTNDMQMQCTFSNSGCNYMLVDTFWCTITRQIYSSSLPNALYITDGIADEKSLNRLCLSPPKGKHKHLFSRYNHLQSIKSSTCNTSFSNAEWNNTNNLKSPYSLCVNDKRVLNKSLSPMYSRLLSSSFMESDTLAVNSASTPKYLERCTSRKSIYFQNHSFSVSNSVNNQSFTPTSPNCHTPTKHTNLQKRNSFALDIVENPELQKYCNGSSDLLKAAKYMLDLSCGTNNAVKSFCDNIMRKEM